MIDSIERLAKFKLINSGFSVSVLCDRAHQTTFIVDCPTIHYTNLSDDLVHSQLVF